MTGVTPRGPFDPRRALGRPLLNYFDSRFRELHDRIRELSQQVDGQMEQLYGRVATEVETISEMTLGMQRFFDISARQVDDLLDRVAVLAPTVGAVDARLVESAFAMSAAGARPGLRVLHIGGDPGVAVALASLGCLVTALGHEGADHPNLVGVEGPIDTWAGADTLFDRVLWLPGRLDQGVLDLLAKCLDVDGELVVSLQDAGDEAVSRALPQLAGWTVLEHRVAVRRGGLTWETVAEGDAGSTTAAGAEIVGLLRATPRK